MKKERYSVKVGDDLYAVGVFDSKEDKYVIYEGCMLLHTAHLICDLLNKVNQQDARIKELEKQLSTATMWQGCDILVNELKQENQQLKEQLAESEKDRLMWQDMYKSADRQNKEICETDIYPLQEEGDCSLIDGCELEEFINNQIKELRSRENA